MFMKIISPRISKSKCSFDIKLFRIMLNFPGGLEANWESGLRNGSL